MTLIPQTNNVQSHSDFALGSLVNDFIPPKDFLEFDSRYGAYRTIGRMTAGIHILHHRDDLLQETIAAVAQKGIIERLYQETLGKTENDWKNLLCWCVKNLAMTKRKLQIYSDKYSDKRLSPEKKVQATFESVDRTRILAERAQPHLGHQDSKVRNLETSLGFTVPNYTIVTAKHFEEYHLFEMNLCLTRGDLAERLIESLYFGDPLNNKECDQIVRSWSVFGDERRIPTSSKNPENRLTAEFVEKMAERAGWDSFPDRTLYHCALLLRALPRPISDELRLHYHQLIERRKSGKSNLSSARREKLRPSVLLLDDFLRDAACLPGYLREFERRAHLEALLSFLQKIWSACVRLTSKTTSFVKFACATSDVQELPS